MAHQHKRRMSHAKETHSRPKGAYSLPNGDYVTQSVGTPASAADVSGSEPCTVPNRMPSSSRPS
jgi:hypothetical protein